jgi:hypothetical protein
MADEPGMPTWVDLTTSDLPGALDFENNPDFGM